MAAARSRRRFGGIGRGTAAGAVIALGGLHAGVTLAETALPERPTDRLTPAVAEELAALAENVGWGSLFHTELMARADTAYGGGPVLAVTAMPNPPLITYLESRAWAVARYLPLEAADARFMERYVEPDEGIVFDLLLIFEPTAEIAPGDLSATFTAGGGKVLPAELRDASITPERVLGDDLESLRGRLTVDLPEGHDWDGIGRMGLEVTAGEAVFDLAWTFPESE